MRRGGVAFGAAVVGGGVVAGWAATQGLGDVLVLSAAAAALLVVFVLPVRAVVWVAGVGVLVTPTLWPVATSVAGADVYVGDLLMALAAFAALVRSKPRPTPRSLLVWLLLLVVWAVGRSAPAGDVAFARLLLPVGVMLLVARCLPAGYDLRRDLRWFPIAVLVSVPLVGGLELIRWASIAGGANETGLVGAVAVALALTFRGPWRAALWLVGIALLVGSASVTSFAAAAVALGYYSFARKGWRLGGASPLLAAWAILVVAASVPVLRPDLIGTVNAHLFQASALGRVLRAGDPVFGFGWANVDRASFVGSDIDGLHNVYLDMLAALGVVGLCLFLLLLAATWRRGDVVARVLLLAWAVWINTTGAFPGAAWGVLGFALAFAALSDQVAEQGDDDALGRAGGGSVDADLDHAARRG